MSFAGTTLKVTDLAKQKTKTPLWPRHRKAAIPAIHGTRRNTLYLMFGLLVGEQYPPPLSVMV